MITKICSFFISAIIPIILSAQIVTTEPPFPVTSMPVTLTFDATQGSGGLAGYTGDVYAHTGVITEFSTTPSDWKYVKTQWGQNTPDTKLNRIGTDLYELEIGPSIIDYYGVPAGEDILQMAFVFRSSEQVNGQWLEGKTSDGGDIFIDLFEPGLNVYFSKPEESLLVELNDTIEVVAKASFADTLALFVNNTLIQQVNGTDEISDTLIAFDYGKYWVRVEASNDTGWVADSFYYYVRKPVVVQDPPADIIDGINYLDDQTVILSLYAPYHEYAFAIGDFSDWEVDSSNYMYRTSDGYRYWVQLDDLEPGKEYIFQYWVDGEIRIGDPYATKVSDPWNDKWIGGETYPGILPYPFGKTTGVATVLQTEQESYNWAVQNFTPPDVTDLVIYELLLRDFTEEHTWQSLIDTLGYLKNLGINAIELMPVNEFEGNISWGYNPNYYFAPDKYYGPASDLKHFIDVCHSEGIAVILDVVYNHSFGTSPYVKLYWDAENNRPAQNSPYYNPVPKHDFNVGYDMNHESLATRKYIGRALRYWLEEYRVDGYRFDLSKGFTQTNTLGNTGLWGQYDPTRVSILKAYADTVWAVNPDAYVILEHFADNSEEKILADYGMMTWGKMNSEYSDAAMGWTGGSDLTWGSYEARGWDDPHLVTYMESHDEERLMYKNYVYGNFSNPSHDTRDTTLALRRMQLAASFFFTIPGPKMIWQFGEMGYDYTIDFNGRTGPKPIRWDYYQDARRKYLHDFYAELIRLKVNEPAFRTEDFTLAVSGAVKRINLNHPDMNVTILGNFDVVEKEIISGFQHPGKWYDYFSGDSITVSTTTEILTLQPGESHIYTDKKLETPLIGLGIPGHATSRRELDAVVFPNPSREGFTFSFHIPVRVQVNLDVFSANGNLVRNLLANEWMQGDGKIFWDACDEAGRKLTKGVFVYRLVAGSYRKSGSLIIP
ncbi:MAG: Por secretion system protein [Bacteroidales bacterium]|nr:Por secretion system protein [Bacteroidales bacterium]